MRFYTEADGDEWVEYGYRSGHGWATANHNLSQESRDSGVSLPLLKQAWGSTTEWWIEDHVGSD